MGYNYNGPVAPPSPSYGSPSQGPVTSYDPPSSPNSLYGAPAGPSVPSSGYPAAQYGAPETSQAPIIHKHVYVHVPPPEPEIIAPTKTYNIPPPQKHYKIVFIKAPTAPAPTAPVIPVIPQNEEKTLVYVLVKKPDDQPDIVIPTPAPTQPSKPEVYFIRYKTQKQEDGGGGGGYPPSISQAPPASLYGAPSPVPPPVAPSGQYGPPTGTVISPSQSYGAPPGPPAPPGQAYGSPN